MYRTRASSTLLSGLLHAAVIAVVLFTAGVKPVKTVDTAHSVLIMPEDLYFPKAATREPGGGGGGVRSPLPASQGRLPRQALRQFTPPQVILANENPKLAMEPTILVNPNIKLPNVDLAQYGIPNGVVGPLSGGPGSGGGLGNGDGTGVGNSKGSGFGDGPGGSGFGGTAGFRGAITPPSIANKTEPEYTDEARKAHIQGIVMLAVQVDASGRARDIQVRQSLGMGLDERAVESVKHWLFHPATQNGKPVPSPAIIMVNFRLL